MNTKNDVFFQPLDRELRLAIANDLFCKFYDGEQYSPQLQLDIARKHSKGDNLLLMKLTKMQRDKNMKVRYGMHV